MQVIDILDEDCINYKKISMFVALPFCSGKCYKELGLDCSICQNDELRKMPIKNIDSEKIIERYHNNFLSEAIVFGGLEPLDSFSELFDFIEKFRKTSLDDIVIYTGYKENEIEDKIEKLKNFQNIIIKIGRYIPNKNSTYCALLGLSLASDNQYAIKLN